MLELQEQKPLQKCILARLPIWYALSIIFTESFTWKKNLPLSPPKRRIKRIAWQSSHPWWTKTEFFTPSHKSSPKKESSLPPSPPKQSSSSKTSQKKNPKSSRTLPTSSRRSERIVSRVLKTKKASTGEEEKGKKEGEGSNPSVCWCKVWEKI